MLIRILVLGYRSIDELTGCGELAPAPFAPEVLHLVLRYDKVSTRKARWIRYGLLVGPRLCWVVFCFGARTWQSQAVC